MNKQPQQISQLDLFQMILPFSSEQTHPIFLEQMEHTKVEHENLKPATSHDDTDHTQTTPPPPKSDMKS